MQINVSFFKFTTLALLTTHTSFSDTYSELIAELVHVVSLYICMKSCVSMIEAPYLLSHKVAILFTGTTEII